MADSPKGGAVFLKKNIQLIYAIVLITLIPVAIIANTYLFIRSFSNTIDISLQREALMVAEVFNAGVENQLTAPDQLQTQLEATAKLNPDIVSMDIFVPDGDNFRDVASLDKTVVGQTSTNIQNVIAWHQNQAIAYQTNAGGSSILNETVQLNERFWTVVAPLQDSSGNKQALLAVKLSLKIVDLLTQQTLFRSYLILAATILIIVLLLAMNTRLFQYAVLFRKIKEVDEMKDEFISMTSHELRTPITAIKGYLSMFLEGSFGKLPATATQNIKVVYDASDRLALLIEDLLNVSRIEQGRLEIKAEPVDAMKLVEGIVMELKVPAEQKGLYLKIEPPTEILREVSADQAKLKQVMVNIIGNAIKYTLKGGVNVTLTPKDNFLEIKVIDTGIGMSPKARERLFEKFYRVKTPETEAINGTGLGLWITKRLVEMMNGQIFVDSIEHVGTQVTVTLPYAKKTTTV